MAFLNSTVRKRSRPRDADLTAEPIPGAWEGGRPMLGLFSARQRETTAADMAGQVKKLAVWPNAWLRCETNDDFCLKYGWDYSDPVKQAFKEKTGLDAPVPPELAKQGSCLARSRRHRPCARNHP